MSPSQADEKARLIGWTPVFPKKKHKAPFKICTTSEAEREITVVQCIVVPEDAREIPILQGVVFPESARDRVILRRAIWGRRRTVLWIEGKPAFSQTPFTNEVVLQGQKLREVFV